MIDIRGKCRTCIARGCDGYFPRGCSAGTFFPEDRYVALITPVEMIFTQILTTHTSSDVAPDAINSGGFVHHGGAENLLFAKG